MAKPIKKQSWEAFTVAGDFVEVLENDETIIVGASTVLAFDKNGNNVSSSIVDAVTLAVDSSKLIVRIQAGTESLSPYNISFRMVTNLGNKWEIDVELQVKELAK